MKKKFHLILAWSILLAGCGSEKKNGNRSSKPPAPNQEGLDAIFGGEVVPLTDGGAYYYSYIDQIWYVRGGKAIKVKLKIESQVSDTFVSYISTPPVPTLDGGAYLYIDKVGLGYLKRDTLYKVSETKKMDFNQFEITSREKQLELLLVNEISKNRRKIESESESDNDDYSSNEPDVRELD